MANAVLEGAASVEPSVPENDRVQWARKCVTECEERLDLAQREGPRLKWIWLVGLPLSVLLFFVSTLFGVLGLAAVIVFYATGRYLNFFQLQDADVNLRKARVALATMIDAQQNGRDKDDGASMSTGEAS